MKRILVTALAFVMAFESLAFAGGDSDFIINENFNSDIEELSLWSFTDDVTNEYVPENKAGDLSLRLCTADSQNSRAAVHIEDKDRLTFDFNIRCETEHIEREIALCDKNSAQVTVLILKNLQIFIPGSTESACTAELKPGKWFNIAIEADKHKGLVKIFINGVSAAEYRNDFTSAELESVVFIHKGKSGASDITFLDDVRVYEGGFRNDYTVKKTKYFSSVAVPKPVGGIAEDAMADADSSQLIWYENFNQYGESEKQLDAITFVENNGNIQTVKTDARHSISVELRTEGASANPILTKNMYMLSQTSPDAPRLKADILGDFVIDFDSLYSDTEHMRIFAIKDDNNEKTHNIFRTTVGGGWAFESNPSVYSGAYEANRWYSIQVVFKADGDKYKYYDLYINNEKVADNLEIAGEPFGEVKILRISEMGKADASGSWWLDNFKIYKGSKPIENLNVKYYKTEVVGQNEETATPFDEPEKVRELLKNMVILGRDSSYAINHGVKVFLDEGNPNVKMIIHNSRTYVPVRFLAECLGSEVKWKAETSEVEIQRNDTLITLSPGKENFAVNGKILAFEAEPLFTENRVFVPLRDITRALGMNIKWFDNGLVAVGDGNERFVNLDSTVKNRSLLKCAYSLIYYPTPEADEILADYWRVSSEKNHPCVAVDSKSFERIKTLINKYPQLYNIYQRALSSADELFEKPLHKYELSGGQGTLMNTARDAKLRIENLCVSYYVTGEEKYKERLWQELEALCSFPDWNPGNGLSIAEMTYAVTIGYDWMHSEWTPQQREIIETAIHDKALSVIYEAYTSERADYGWVKNTNNWNSVTNSCFAMAAAVLMDKYPQLCSFIVENAFVGLSYFLDSYASDGGFPEGPGYWAYATKYLTCFMSTLENCMGTDYGLYSSPGISRTGYFVEYMIGGPSLFNFHDSSETMDPSPEMMYFGKREGSGKLQEARLYQISSGLSASNVYDLAWYDETLVSDGKALPMDAKFENISTASFRSAWQDSNCTYAGIHAGSINAGHAQLDIGDFIIDAVGERWACELAMEDYAYEGYFGGDSRWNYYRARSEGQNTVVINPSELPEQDTETAQGIIEKFESKEKGGFAVIDTTSAYKRYAHKSRRGLMLTDDRQTVIVRDEITLKDESEVYWFMHTKADIEIVENGKKAVLSQNGKTYYAKIAGDNTFEFSVMNAEPLETSPQIAQSENKGVKKLVIHGKYLKEFNVSVVFSHKEENLEREAISLDDWYIEDGRNGLPSADMIFAGEHPIESFSPYKSKYTIMLTSENTVPKTTVSSEYPYRIDEADSIYDTTFVTVYDRDNPDNSLQYEISYQKALTIGKPESMHKLEVESVTASYSPQAEMGYVPENTLDGDFSTRWSAESGEYLVYDLGKPCDVAGFGVAWLNGTARYSYYTVLVSEDGINWKTVFSGKSTGVTSSIETTTFESVKARYVKMVGHGNSRSTWTSPLEVEIYGNN